MIQSATTFKNRRAYQRLPVRLPVKFHNMDADDCKSASSIDISPGGLGIFTEHALQPRQQLSVSVKFLDGGQPLIISGTVVWCMRKMSRLWRAGIQFNQPNFDYLKRLSSGRSFS